MFQFIKINWKCVFILIKFPHGTDVWNSVSSASVAHLFEVFENCSIRLSNDWNSFYETNDHLQQFRADKLSSFFKSEALTFSSASFIEFIQLWLETLQHIERFSRPFCLLHLIDNFFSAFSIAVFRSFTFFSSDSQLCVVGFLIKQLFYSGLLDMKWS